VAKLANEEVLEKSSSLKGFFLDVIRVGGAARSCFYLADYVR